MRWRVSALWTAALLAAAGCAPNHNTELLEARLRQQEDRLISLQAELEEARREQLAARREADALRARLSESGQTAAPPEVAAASFHLERIELSRLMTGGLDRDDQAGDEMLSAVVLPLDGQGSLVKAAGRIELELLDLSRPDGERRIGRWEFNTQAAAENWRTGLVASGYIFKLPWQEAPTSERLLLWARLTTSDGRRFDANREISIDPPGPHPAFTAAP